ncbi:Pancreatic lipase-related protein 2 [Halotydeus destructor]|nr:Pancreatic lipase-related protein 2 [Halotydeus destructor]
MAASCDLWVMCFIVVCLYYPITEGIDAAENRQAGNKPTVPDMVQLYQHHRLLGFLPFEDEPLKHIGDILSTPSEIMTKFVWYDVAAEKRLELDYLKWEETKPTVSSTPTRIFFLTHGFKGTIGKKYIEMLFSLQGYVPGSIAITVDWRLGADSINSNPSGKKTDYAYDKACVNSMIVGREVALVTYLLMSAGIVTPDKVHYIGDGLGAHVMHFAGQHFKTLSDRISEVDGGPRGQGRVGRITGLDPFAEHFQGYGTVASLPYLNVDDADFVDIIHTSAVTDNGSPVDKEAKRFGMSIASGHVDFYPNGGQKQPFCTKADACSHMMAMKYFALSLTSDPKTRSHLVAHRADNYPAYLEKHGPGVFSSWMPFMSSKPVAMPDPTAMLMGIDAEKNRAMYEDTPNPFFLDIALDSENALAEVPRRPYFSSVPNVQLYELDLPTSVITDDGYDFKKFPSHRGPFANIQRNARDFNGCGKFLAPPNGTDGRVHFGLEPYIRQFPWLVCMILPAKNSAKQIYFAEQCTGTLVSDEFIITAAHCLESYHRKTKDGKMVPINGLPMYLAFGNDCKRPIARRTVVIHQYSTSFIHPLYSYDTHPMTRFDVALIKLVDPIEPHLLPQDGVFGTDTKLNIVCWRDANLFNYQDCSEQLYFAGYGLNELQRRISSGYLRWTVKKIRLYRNEAYAHVMAAYNSEKKLLRNSCPGDSGGPYLRYLNMTESRHASDHPQLSPYTAQLLATHMGGTECDKSDRVTKAAELGHPAIYEFVVDVVDTEGRQAVGPISPPDKSPSFITALPNSTATLASSETILQAKSSSTYKNKRRNETPADGNAPKKQTMPSPEDTGMEYQDNVLPSDASEAAAHLRGGLQIVSSLLNRLIAENAVPGTHLQSTQEAATMANQLFDFYSRANAPEPMTSSSSEQRFEKLEKLVATRLGNYSAVTQRRLQPIISPPPRRQTQASPNLTIKLDCLESANLGSAGLRQEIIDKIPPRNGDSGVNRMKSLGPKSLLIDMRDEESMNDLVTEIEKKLKDRCEMGTPHYKLPTVRVEGLENNHSGTELKQYLDRKFPDHKDNIKVLLMHKIRKGNQQAAIVRVPKEVHRTLLSNPELYFEYVRLTVKRHTHVTMCYKCQLYGHISSNCPNSTKCSHCSEEHAHKDCTLRISDHGYSCAVCKHYNGLNSTCNQLTVQGAYVGTIYQAPTNTSHVRAAIILLNSDLEGFLRHEHSTPERVVVDIYQQEKFLITVVSEYCHRESSAELSPLHSTFTVIDSITLTGRRFLYGADANSWSPLWGSLETDNRGQLWEDYLSNSALQLLNDGQPTFARATATGMTETAIDITLASPNLSCQWEIDKDYSLSDHRAILITVGDDLPSTLPGARAMRNPYRHLCSKRFETELT